MAAQYVVVGRRDLPARTKPWQLALASNAGGVDVHEAGVVYDEETRAKVAARVSEIVGWPPQSIVFVRKVWDLAQVVAEELATSVEGVVFCDIDNEVFFDALGDARTSTSIADLEARLNRAFHNPQPFFDRWAKEEKARFEAAQKSDPDVAAANDWSDVEV